MMAMLKLFTVSLCLLLILPTVSIAAAEESSESWVPYLPSPNQVDLSIKVEGGCCFITVVLVFPDGGFRVSWSEVVLKNRAIFLGAEVERWTGPAIQVITLMKHTYEVEVQAGVYHIIFTVNGKPVKSSTFTVGETFPPPRGNLPFLCFLSALALTVSLLTRKMED